MSPKKIIKLTILMALIAGLIYGIHYAWVSFPIISGYSAKNVCSCVFVEGRNEADVKREELGDFPKSLGRVIINWKDSSVTGSVWGFARRKAIYRERLGCTLVNDIPEPAIRSQQFSLPGNITSVHADSIAWPLGDRLTDTFPAGIKKKQLDEAVDFAFTETDSSKKVITRAILVLYNGKLIAEKYAPGFDHHSRMLGWSIAKSFMGALIGILVHEGRLNVALPAPVPKWQSPNDPRHAISLENLLQQTSGLNFREDYTRFSEVTNMLFNKGNMPGFTEELSLKYLPGTVFNYSSGNSNILSHIIRQAVGEKDYWSFPYIALFNKLGMYSALLEPDASGNFVGSSYIFATARDYARFGLLYYNDGVWNGERILPEGWVKKTITAPPVNRLKNYGYQFWLNGFAKKDSTILQYPDVPADMYYADGYGGQDIYIIPSKKLVVVRLGLHGIDENSFLKRVVKAVE
jgi:CubicO group peptidase (beta-lactamase class C family)